LSPIWLRRDRRPVAPAPLLQVGLRRRRQHDRRPRSLAEVEVGREVAKLGGVLPNVRARVGPAVGGRIEALAAQEVVLDEFEVGVEAQRLTRRTVDRSGQAKANRLK